MVDLADELLEGEGPRPVAPARRHFRASVATMVVLTVVVIVLSVLALRSAPPTSMSHWTIVQDTGITVGPGSGGAVYFEFQPSPGPSVSDSLRSGVTNASLSGEVVVTGCPASGCASVRVELMTSPELSELRSTGSAGAVWCAQSCAPTSTAQFNVDVTAYSNNPLNLVLIPVSGSTATVSASATLFWTDD
jgi:hypothetical protein